MAKKKAKAQPVDRAVPTIRKPKKTDAQKVVLTRTTTTSMQTSQNWAAATDLQAAVKAWNKNADDMDANAKVIAGLKDQLRTAESTQRTNRRNWQASNAQVLSTLNVFCNGSADMVKSFSVDVRTRIVLGALPAVEGLTVDSGLLIGEVVASWPRGAGRHGFVVQHATDPTTAATFSGLIPWTKTKYTLGGSPSGSNVSFRVAYVDPTSPTGMGPWCPWTAGTAK